MCYLHTGEALESEKILLFNNGSLSKCRVILNFRKTNGLKYSEIILLDHRDIGGYRRFVALSKAQRKRMKAVCVEGEEDNKGTFIISEVNQPEDYICKSDESDIPSRNTRSWILKTNWKNRSFPKYMYILSLSQEKDKRSRAKINNCSNREL